MYTAFLTSRERRFYVRGVAPALRFSASTIGREFFRALHFCLRVTGQTLLAGALSLARGHGWHARVRKLFVRQLCLKTGCCVPVRITDAHSSSRDKTRLTAVYDTQHDVQYARRQPGMSNL